ncbi:hypothetical protein ONZ51_g10119 [Trametes cubensis]|uniref:Uncharacterized protein n=1 Tax=Trametes cubensis TaxID=1111947 RepID=A0AAD7TLY2_9APHY|nr:hypothetical protein ONZ51_g10119 [Trametes cubensis]
MGSTFLPGANTPPSSDSRFARTDNEADEDNIHVFPALERIHIVLSTLSHPISSTLLRPLEVAANTLTHARISNVDSAAQGMKLVDALTPDDHIEQSPFATFIGLFPSLVLPALCHVAIQYTLRGENEPEVGGPQSFVSAFNAHDGRTGHMYLFGDRERPPSYWRNRVEEEWLDRIEGGYGCWVQNIEQEGARWEDLNNVA